MDKRGHCRCGTLLVFRATAQGYKTRCTVCHSVVRLREELVSTGSPPMRPGVLTPPPLSKASLRSRLPNPNVAVDATPVDLNALDTRDEPAPPALTEIKAYRERRRPTFWHRHGAWVIVGVLLGLVVGLVGIALL